MENGKPYRFIRKVDEGGYTKDIEINFDYQKKQALLDDKKNDKKFTFTLEDGIQDLVSAFYYLRNNYRAKDLEIGKSIELNMLYDG